MARSANEPRDEVLVLGAILGDLEAFGELVTRYRRAVVRTAQTIVGREDAEDVAQDALLLAFKALPSIDDPTKFAAWLSAITRHRALRFGKQEKARTMKQVAIDGLLLERIHPLSKPLVEDDNRYDELRDALDQLRPEYSLVLRLHFFDEMPLKRISAYLGVSVSTVKWRIHRGKNQLREEFGRDNNARYPWKEKKRSRS